jgi:hypothetical protein
MVKIKVSFQTESEKAAVLHLLKPLLAFTRPKFQEKDGHTNLYLEIHTKSMEKTHG